jgi:2-succinyl-5-enolpyruvyl-6-hydroxy-3-cyclohexene-1-carboxylate synthase
VDLVAEVLVVVEPAATIKLPHPSRNILKAKTKFCMSLLDTIFKITKICSENHIKDVVLCPGSRSAALSLAFNRNPQITTTVLSDERSAAFVAMGMASQSGQTVALVCTSGSAAYNFAPAVAEAFFQEVPLLVLTADRPPEWIHQYDGQTIFQQDIYGKHVKKSYQLPSDYQSNDAKWHAERVIHEALFLAQSEPKGPVHINIPIREPFYPDTEEIFDFNLPTRSLSFFEGNSHLSNPTWETLLEIWENTESKMIAIGQNQYELSTTLKNLEEEEGVVVLADIISNVNLFSDSYIRSHDIFLGKTELTSPELLITVGKSFISKGFKQYLRAHKPRYHWHIQENLDLIDPFQSITHKINVSPVYFLDTLFENLEARRFKNGEDENDDLSFSSTWQKAEANARKHLSHYLNTAIFGEFQATARLLETLPAHAVLHLGNSMPVRYANLLGSFVKNPLQAHANRGTSGIDGILSTAIGQAMKTTQLVICLIGDVSFFYDRNAFWNAHLPQNLRVVLINNAGGNIFRIIDGPSKQPELEKVFIGHQPQQASSLCQEYGIDYVAVSNMENLATSLQKIYDPHAPLAIIEIFVDGKTDAEIFKQIKASFGC